MTDAIAQVRAALRDSLPLIGFAGSPYTLACYMVEGGSSQDFRQIKSLLYGQPALLHRLLEVNARAVAACLNAQIEAGADAVMIFDTWGGSLSAAAYREFSLGYILQVLAALTRERDGMRVPSIVFTKGGGMWLEDIAASGCDCIGLDWTVQIAEAQRRIGKRVALQGNLDPMVLLATPQAVATEARKVLAGFGSGPGHVFNLGHGISQFTPPENVQVLVQTVHQESRRIRAASQ